MTRKQKLIHMLVELIDTGRADPSKHFVGAAAQAIIDTIYSIDEPLTEEDQKTLSYCLEHLKECI